MRLILLLLLLASIAPEVALSRGPRPRGTVWRQDRLHIYDHSPEQWQPEVARAVAAVDAMLPGRAPTLLYHAMPETPCEALPRRRRAIVVCLIEPENLWHPGSVAQADIRETYHRKRGRSMRWVRLEFANDRPLDQSIVCHELFHGLTGIRKHGEWINWHPCPFDARQAKRVYRLYDRKHARR